MFEYNSLKSLGLPELQDVRDGGGPDAAEAQKLIDHYFLYNPKPMKKKKKKKRKIKSDEDMWW